MKKAGLFLAAILLTISFSTIASATTYYSQGSVAPNVLTNWNTVRGGGGSNPGSFTTANDVFVIQSPHNMTTSAAWSFGGTGSKLQIESGGTLTATSAVTIAGGATFQIDGGGTYVHNNATAYGSSIFNGTESFAATSTVILNNSNTSGPSGVTFGNLTVNFTSDPGGNVNCSGGLTAINGNLTVISTSTRQFILTGNTSLTLTIAGNYNQSGGTFVFGNNNSNPVVNVQGDLSISSGTLILINQANQNGALNLSGNFSHAGGTITASGTNSFGTIAFVGSTQTFTSGGTVSGSVDFTVNSPATLNMGTSVMSGRNFTLSSGATLGIGSTDGITSSGATGNIQVSGTRSFSTGANYTYNGSAAQVTGNGLPSPVNNFTIANSAGISLTNSLTVNGALTLTSGTLGVGTTTLTLNSTVSATSGSLSSATAGAVNYNQSSNGQAVLAANYGNLQFSNFNKTLPSSGTVGIANTFTPGTATGHTITGSTIDFTSSGAQTIPAFNYNNLSNSGNGSRTLASSGTVGISGSFSPGSATYTVAGSTVDYNGSSMQTGPAVVFIYNNLTVSNSAGLTLAANQTVNGALALTGGDITTGANTLFQSGTSSGTADVVGNVNRSDLNGGTARSFGNPFVQITETAGTVSDITVNLVKSAPSDFGNAIRRTYTITPNGGTNLIATLQLHYLDNELNGNTEASLELWRKDSTLGWQNQGKDPIGGSDTTNNWVKLSSVSQFSPWTLGTSAPTDVALMNFNAVSDPQGRVLLEWQTGYEIGNLGFNLYRDVGGKREQVNPTLIAGSVMMAGRTPMTAGLNYAWIDKLAGPKDYALYWLEDLDASGKTTWHGPVSPVAVAKLPERAESLLVSRMQAGTRGSSTERFLRPVVNAGKIASMPRDIQRQWEVAGRAGAKFLISKSGWYRVSQPQLVAAGFDTSKDPRFYQLFLDGSEIPLLINGGQGGRLEPADSIEFYAAAINSPDSNQRALFLTLGAQPGRRLVQLPFADGKPSARANFTAVRERRDRYIYLPALNNGDRENWFGAFIDSSPFTMPLTLSQVDPDAADQATLEVALQGLGSDTPPQPHLVRVQVNGQEAGAFAFSGSQYQVAQLSVSARLLKEGANSVTLQGMAGAADYSLVDWLRLSYAHRLVADQDTLLLVARQDEQVQVSGFTTAAVRVFDVTEEANPLELGAKVEAAGPGYRVTAAAQEVGERVLLVVGERAYQQAQVVQQVGTSWHAANQGADVVMVVGAGLRGAVEPLVGLRKQQGYAVAVVEVEDVYDEFSYGQKAAQAVQDFVAATRQWKRVPRWLLLVGDASYDPKDYTGLGDWDLVPTKQVWVNTMETASDEWLGDVNGDGLAEVAVGRLPVRTAQQAQALVTKIVSYAQSAQTQGALLVADTPGEYDFEAASNAIEQLIPADTHVQKVYRRLTDDQTASRAIIEAVNRGPKLVNYAGHGSASVWRGNLLTINSVAQMSNGQALPVVVSMTCLNGMFIDPYTTSLGEALLLSGQGGAIAVWASSAQTVAGAQELVNQEMVRQLLNGVGGKGRPLTIGEAIQRAKAVALDESVTRSWILLGDPMTVVR